MYRQIRRGFIVELASYTVDIFRHNAINVRVRIFSSNNYCKWHAGVTYELTAGAPCHFPEMSRYIMIYIVLPCMHMAPLYDASIYIAWLAILLISDRRAVNYDISKWSFVFVTIAARGQHGSGYFVSNKRHIYPKCYPAYYQQTLWACYHAPMLLYDRCGDSIISRIWINISGRWYKKYTMQNAYTAKCRYDATNYIKILHPA